MSHPNLLKKNENCIKVTKVTCIICTLKFQKCHTYAVIPVVRWTMTFYSLCVEVLTQESPNITAFQGIIFKEAVMWKKPLSSKEKQVRTQTCTERRPQEDTLRSWPHGCQGQASEKTDFNDTFWLLTSRSIGIHFCSLNHSYVWYFV